MTSLPSTTTPRPGFTLRRSSIFMRKSESTGCMGTPKPFID